MSAQGKLLESDSQIILNENGRAAYHPSAFSAEESEQLFKILLETIAWHRDEVVLFGKHHIMRRKSAWYGSQSFNYTYSKIERTALPWTPVLLRIKTRIEEGTDTTYNSCLLNLYHDGEDGMGWHSDDEPELDPTQPICSVSFGADRKFAFKRKIGGKSIDLLLENGSALYMHPPIQEYWKHSLKKSKRIFKPRINLTFRVMLS